MPSLVGSEMCIRDRDSGCEGSPRILRAPPSLVMTMPQ